MSETIFTLDHNGYLFQVTAWNLDACKNPKILFDYNNVLNVYTRQELLKAAKLEPQPYAIVSLLMTTGENFQSLKKQAQETKECIVAVTAKIKGNRQAVETGLKYAVMKKLHWSAMAAFDDKPHEWFSPEGKYQYRQLKLDAQKKPVYVINYLS